jgi:hypothetical protein
MTRAITGPQKLWRSACAIIAAALIAGPAMAGSPGCSAPEYRQLDFWLGNWQALDDGGKGPPVARDEITGTLDGCVILERYRQNDGLDGNGVTIYDASRKLWHQTWVTNSGQLLIIEGRFDGDVLTMSGDNLGKGGKRIWYRVTWKPQAEGVREIALTSKDAGRSWQPAFDILFVKVSTGRKD